MGNFGQVDLNKERQVEGEKRNRKRRAESTSAAAQRLSRGEANWMFLGDLFEAGGPGFAFFAKVGLDRIGTAPGLWWTGAELVARCRDGPGQKLCVCARWCVWTFFFFLTRDNPPAVRSCSVARFACSRPASSQLSGGVSILSTVNGRRLGSRYSARRVDPTRRERRGGRGEEWKLKAAKEYTGPGH